MQPGACRRAHTFAVLLPVTTAGGIPGTANKACCQALLGARYCHSPPLHPRMRRARIRLCGSCRDDFVSSCRSSWWSSSTHNVSPDPSLFEGYFPLFLSPVHCVSRSLCLSCMSGTSAVPRDVPSPLCGPASHVGMGDKIGKSTSGGRRTTRRVAGTLRLLFSVQPDSKIRRTSCNGRGFYPVGGEDGLVLVISPCLQSFVRHCCFVFIGVSAPNLPMTVSVRKLRVVCLCFFCT